MALGRLRRAAIAWAGVAAGATAWAGTTTAFTFARQAYDGSNDRTVKVYVPDGLGAAAPMVMALHGCEETNDNVLRDWGLTAAADRFGFILVAPFITRYDPIPPRNTNCWGFWIDAHRHQGAGEVEDLHRIAQQVEARWRIDPKRRYVTGLSSGGAMAVAMAVAHNEYWAAAASASGLPYGEASDAVSLSGSCPGRAQFHSVASVAGDMRRERNSGYPIPLMVLQNQRDCTVLITAARNLRDAHLKVFGSAGHDTPATAQASQSACAVFFGDALACEHTVYTASGAGSGRSVVETVFYDGPLATPDTSDKDHGHYWIGGEQGRDGPYAVRRGPAYPELVWAFFSRQVHDEGIEPTPTQPPAAGCATRSDSPAGHVAAGRASTGGWFSISALSSGDRRPIGVWWDSWSRVSLREGPQGRWYFGAAPGCPA
ncbi:MAG TPA: PHB depolymerase family esterase [Albitalea sp.]|uniref:extracellular catalytic domain type 1 short-chain-length polyhydroxyalkanoate depolymerase n=1 Tax=Piscinibacter sp. TaxID=1903157 RepID=UPI002ECFC060